MTHTPICACNVDVAQRDETDPATWPPAVFRVDHCPLHRAAPELLEACKAVVKSAVDEDGCTWCDRASQWGHEEWCPIPLAIAAIAKVEGEQ